MLRGLMLGITPGVSSYATGGRVYGPSHAQGGVLAELEGGEYVIPKNIRSMQAGGSAAVTGGSGYADRDSSGGAGGGGGGGGLGDLSTLKGILNDWLQSLTTALAEDRKLFMDGLLDPDTGFVAQFSTSLVEAITPLIAAIMALTAVITVVFLPVILMIVAVLGSLYITYLALKAIVEYLTTALTRMWEQITQYDWAGSFGELTNGIATAFMDGITNALGLVDLGKIFGDWISGATGIKGVRMSFFNYGRIFGSGEDKWLIDIPIGYKEGEPDQTHYKFDKGGELYGPSHASGGIPIEAEGGEWVISKKAVDFWGSDFFKALNDRELPTAETGVSIGKERKSAGISTDDFLHGDARTLWNKHIGERYIRGWFQIGGKDGGQGAGLNYNLWGSDQSMRDGGLIKAEKGFDVGKVTHKYLGIDAKVGSKATGYVEAMLGMDLPKMKTHSDLSYTGPDIVGGIGDLLRIGEGGYLPSFGLGGSVDPTITVLLTELVDLMREGRDTEVNVFTDMRGESRAAISDFRSEMRERDLRGLRTA
jgi:hypothetical protein